MSRGTTFKIFAVDYRPEMKFTQDDIKKVCATNYQIYSIGTSGEKPTLDDALKAVEDERSRPSSLCPVYEEIPSKEEGIPSQWSIVKTPFDMWIDVKTGQRVYMVSEYDFPSDFGELKDFFCLNSYSASTNGVEIPREAAEKMLQVVNYILAGDYSEKVERSVFFNNAFFKVFEDQFFSFSTRFDERRDEDSEREFKEIKDSDRNYCEALKMILSAFLGMVESSERFVREGITYRLGYFAWG